MIYRQCQRMENPSCEAKGGGRPDRTLTVILGSISRIGAISNDGTTRPNVQRSTTDLGRSSGAFSIGSLGALAPSDCCFRSIAGAKLEQYFGHMMLDRFLLKVQAAADMLV